MASAHAIPVVYVMIVIPTFKEWSSVWKSSGMANRRKSRNLPLHSAQVAYIDGGFPCGSRKEPAWQYRRHERHRFHPWVKEDPLQEGMATHSGIPAWRSPWTEESGGPWPIGLQKVRHKWSDSAHKYISLVTLIGELEGQWWAEKWAERRNGGELLDRRLRKTLKNFHWDAEKLSRTGRGESRRGWRWEKLNYFL